MHKKAPENMCTDIRVKKNIYQILGTRWLWHMFLEFLKYFALVIL